MIYNNNNYDKDNNNKLYRDGGLIEISDDKLKHTLAYLVSSQVGRMRSCYISQVD